MGRVKQLQLQTEITGGKLETGSVDGPTRKHVEVCVKSCCYASNCYRQVLTCACNVAFAGSRGRLAVLQTYQVLCALLLNQMPARNYILVMGKCEEKLFGFLFLGGKCRHRAPGPCWCAAHMHVWQVALQEGCCHHGCEWSGGLTWQPLHRMRLCQGVKRAVKVSSRGVSSSNFQSAFSLSAGRGIFLSCYTSSRAL